MEIKLPIDSVLPDLLQALTTSPNVVLEAPPGAGKTTKVPLALLNESWLQGQKIIILEPRRLAARAAATRMANMLGEKVGETVGYRIRMDQKIGPNTRIEVVTEGILTRLLQNDPELIGIGAILFDEFHERSLQADLGLALTLDCQAALREDLRLLVMSATLDGDAVSKLIGQAPVIRSDGKIFPVQTKYLGKPSRGELEKKVSQAIQLALAEEKGSILVFLPGEREIKNVENLLKENIQQTNVIIAPLYGALSQKEQDIAIKPSPTGTRKIVLATAIAETSLTIDGIRVVIDAGLSRTARFNVTNAMNKLETIPVAKSSADQRQGRAGRLEPGMCYRLWEEAAHGGLRSYPSPEILEADLAPLALELAAWGINTPDGLNWMTPPPEKPYKQACQLLMNLEALDQDYRITQHGKAIAKLGMHPRLAHMTLRAKENGNGYLACLIAALLTERDFLSGKGPNTDADLKLRLQIMAAKKPVGLTDLTLKKGALMRAKATANNWQKKLGTSNPAKMSFQDAGKTLALAYPDRVAQRRAGASARYLLTNGSGAQLNQNDPLAGENYLVIAELGGFGTEPKIFIAAPIDKNEIEETFDNIITQKTEIKWDKKSESVSTHTASNLGAITLSSTPIESPNAEIVCQALIDGIRLKGSHILPWTPESENLRNRLSFLCKHQPEDDWPDMSENQLLDTMEIWLAPYLSGITKLSQLSNLDMVEIIKNQLDWEKQQILDKSAPSHQVVPSGSKIRIDYSDVDAPVLPVKLQEMFGSDITPTLLNGSIPITLHLLSPAGRPLQVTQDLPAFWQNGYRHVKAEMKGRYPKHPWPDDPTTAVATAKTKRHIQG